MARGKAAMSSRGSASRSKSVVSRGAHRVGPGIPQRVGDKLCSSRCPRGWSRYLQRMGDFLEVFTPFMVRRTGDRIFETTTIS